MESILTDARLNFGSKLGGLETGHLRRFWAVSRPRDELQAVWTPGDNQALAEKDSTGQWQLASLSFIRGLQLTECKSMLGYGTGWAIGSR